ncbi:MAG: prephenate dehydrogenase [Salinirussus sp.]
MDALVVGAGEMGTWLGGVVSDAGFDSVAFTDVDPDRAATAAATHPEGRTAAMDGDETFELVCVAVPLPAATETIAAVAGRAGRALIDVTGRMAGPVRAMRRVAPECERVSLHPLFAPEAEPGNVAVVADDPGPVTDEVRTALSDRGNDCFRTTPAEHDRAMETVQAKCHAAVLAYALAADDVPERFHTPVSAGLADLVATVTGNESRVYADIQAAFDGADAVAESARRLADADRETFRRLYERL